MKFSGEETTCGWFHYKVNDPYIQITLQFEDWPTTSDARVHCNQFLDDEGSVLSSYREALKHSDPSFVMANKIKKRALSNHLDI